MDDDDVFAIDDPCVPIEIREHAVRFRTPVRYVGLDGAAIGVDSFGESAPAGAVYRHFGVDSDHVVAAVKSVL